MRETEASRGREENRWTRRKHGDRKRAQESESGKGEGKAKEKERAREERQRGEARRREMKEWLGVSRRCQRPTRAEMMLRKMKKRER